MRQGSCPHKAGSLVRATSQEISRKSYERGSTGYYDGLYGGHPDLGATGFSGNNI